MRCHPRADLIRRKSPFRLRVRANVGGERGGGVPSQRLEFVETVGVIGEETAFVSSDSGGGVEEE